jgi:hypothetical protein
LAKVVSCGVVLGFLLCPILITKVSQMPTAIFLIKNTVIHTDCDR